jgi:hypothetical protein
MDDCVPESKEVQRYGATVAREAALRVLESRVRRRLRNQCLVLHKSRGSRQSNLFGRYWVTDYGNVMPILRHVDLPSLASRLGIWFQDLNV